MVDLLNNDDIPEYLTEVRLILISKNCKTTAELENVKPIAMLSHVIKVLEKTIKNKLKSTKSQLLATGWYQKGF